MKKIVYTKSTYTKICYRFAKKFQSIVKKVRSKLEYPLKIDENSPWKFTNLQVYSYNLVYD